MNSSLFEKNIAVLRQHQANLADKLASMKTTHTRLLIPQEEGANGSGQVNIDLGHSHFYATDARDYARDQVETFFKKTSRIYVGWIFKPIEPWTIAEKLYDRVWDWSADYDLQEAKGEVREDSGVALILGFGLGYHVDQLIKELDARVFYVVEQHLEFILHALHLHDLSVWFDTLAKRHGRLEFVVGDVPSHLVSHIHSRIRYTDFGALDGCYFFYHYQSKFMQDMRHKIIDGVSVMNMNPGFFDDECVMLRNAFANLTNPDVSLYQRRARIKKAAPAVVIGSGPSLDNCLDLLKENRQKIVIFSCGTALGALLRNGITPDYHVELENTEGPIKIIRGLAKEFGVADITLLGPLTLRPELVEQFSQSMLFHRDSVTSTFLWGIHDEITMAAPTVTNAGARLAIGFGFEELYLVGVDLGARNQEMHHSKSSIYLADKSFLENSPAHRAASDFQIVQEGNFGGQVYTNSSFQASGNYLAQLILNFPAVRMYNLSDGLRIDGAIPRLPEVVRFLNKAEKAVYDRKLIDEEILKEKNSFTLHLDSLSKLRERVSAEVDDIYNIFDHALGDEIPLYKIFGELQALFQRKPQDNLDLVKRSLLKGTTLLIFQLAFIMYRRLDDRPETKKAYAAFYGSEARRAINEMREQANEMMDELVKKAETHLKNNEL